MITIDPRCYNIIMFFLNRLLKQFSHIHRISVYDVDQTGYIFNTTYIAWMLRYSEKRDFFCNSLFQMIKLDIFIISIQFNLSSLQILSSLLLLLKYNYTNNYNYLKNLKTNYKIFSLPGLCVLCYLFNVSVFYENSF